MVNSASKSEHVDKAANEIAKVVQTCAKFRFQILGTRNLAVAAIEDTKHLKYCRPHEHAEIIAALKKYAGDQRQNKNQRRERVGMNRELHEQTCNAARNWPIQKS